MQNEEMITLPEHPVSHSHLFLLSCSLSCSVRGLASGIGFGLLFFYRCTSTLNRQSGLRSTLFCPRISYISITFCMQTICQYCSDLVTKKHRSLTLPNSYVTRDITHTLCSRVMNIQLSRYMYCSKFELGFVGGATGSEHLIG